MSLKGGKNCLFLEFNWVEYQYVQQKGTVQTPSSKLSKQLFSSPVIAILILLE